LLGDVWKHGYKDMVVVSPDVGGVVRARALAKRLDDADLVIIDKRRDRANQSEVMNIIGEVKGKNCIMMDDMVDTAGTLCHAAGALKKHGAKSVHAYITHAVLSGPAVERISESELDAVVVTDTIPLNEAARACKKIRQLSTAELLAETMRRISDEESVSSLPGLWHVFRTSVTMRAPATDGRSPGRPEVRIIPRKINQIMEFSHG
jgi:ribose-phosphate pyrophosphokinase